MSYIVTNLSVHKVHKSSGAEPVFSGIVGMKQKVPFLNSAPQYHSRRLRHQPSKPSILLIMAKYRWLHINGSIEFGSEYNCFLLIDMT